MRPPGICYEVEQDPWDCREAATQPKEQATSGGKVFVSGEWVHAYAGMGQYEGFYKTSDGGADIYYGCAGFYSSLDFRIPGLHVSPARPKSWLTGAWSRKRLRNTPR